jgi:hypothetical protein
MPMSFYLRLGDCSLGVYTCRESAVFAIRDELLTANGIVATDGDTLERGAFTALRKVEQIQLTARFSARCSPHEYAQLTRYLAELRRYFPKCGFGIEQVSSRWGGTTSTEIHIAGDLSAVHAWWWIVLIVRLVLGAEGREPQYHETIVDLIHHSDPDDEEIWFRRADHDDAVDAWLQIGKLSKRSPVAMLAYGQGPSDLQDGYKAIS